MPDRRPLVEELSPAPAVVDALTALADRPGVVLLDSALRDADRGRYSFLMADPQRVFVRDRATPGDDPFSEFRACLAEHRADPVAGLPPFQGGIAGLLGYELGACWERLPQAAIDDFAMPVVCAGLYDSVVAWDHVLERCWIIVLPFAADPRARLAELRQQLQSPLAVSQPPHSPAPPLCIATPQRPLPVANSRSVPIFSNFSRDEYLTAVARVIEYIRAGDIFQANLSQRLVCRSTTPVLDVYRRLRTVNRAPFAAFLSFDDWTLLSASPERFLCVADGLVETRPIKGTRQRRSNPEADLFTRDELRESDKDQSENVMIVDLLRNDLSRVCRPGTIRVPQLCGVETYETVQHLVSQVCGRLEPGRDIFDVLAATFPGGSITGAPKVRAMEIITELERVARGPYCGSVFYCSLDGRADSSILIRTLVERRGWLSCGVGGGIVAQSDPAAEYDETLHKAAGMLRALNS
jgi:para-aminobenzoate synthetase component 1